MVVTRMDTLKSGGTDYVYYTTTISLFSVLSYDSYHVFLVKMTTLFGVSILVTTILDLCLMEPLVSKSRGFLDVIILKKLRF